MPTTRLFSSVPEFPADVPTANAPRISFSQLEQANEEESKRLYQACREYGYFLLDLRDSADGRDLLKSAEDMYDTAAEVFGLGVEALEPYQAEFPKDLQGYKAPHQMEIKFGRKAGDAAELYTINQDDVTGLGPNRHKPPCLQSRRGNCATFVHRAHDATITVLNVLDKHLDLPPGTLSSLSPMDKLSPTSFRLIRTLPQKQSSDSETATYDQNRIGVPGHTDIGTISMLFNVVGGLQVLPAGSENTPGNWRYVKPELGCAIVQIADTMVEWTGGLLRSNLHRVVDPPGEQARAVRQSLAYLVRPANDGSMKRLKGGKVIPALEDGEEDETRSVGEWATWRASQIIRGQLKPETRGGIMLSNGAGVQAIKV